MTIRLRSHQKIHIQSSADIFHLMQPILRRCSKRDRAREHFWILCLGPGQTVCHLELLALGTQNKVLIDPREVYSLALQQNASSIVAIHNHPSGRLKPSPADKLITQQLMKGSDFLNLRLLDHLIISVEGYFSFMDKGVFELLIAEQSMMFKNILAE
ncbi:MAG: JAB domain-containing protein [Chitinophagaceae bacterium]